MNIVGYILLGLSTLLFFGIVLILFNKESSRRGSGSSYTWSMGFLHLLLFGCMAILAGIISSKGGFAWVGWSGISRFLLVGSGLILSIVGSCLWALFKMDEDLRKGLLKLGSNTVPVLIPLMLLLSGGMLLNDHWRSTIPASTYQWPLMIATALGGIGIVTFVMVLYRQEMQKA